MVKESGGATTVWRSPLRYPGGKYKMINFIRQVLKQNNIDGTYIEAFAGGAGLAINLLLTNTVKNIILNDLDNAIYAFWWALTKKNDEFLLKFDSVEVTIDEWHIQKNIFDKLTQKINLDEEQLLLLGFSTYFLNRTNFSGILRGATPIGGLNQNGSWKIDCQFNKTRLRPLLKKIGDYSDNITVVKMNMISNLSYLTDFSDDVDNTLIFIDPPYVKEGKRLYLPIKSIDDHVQLSRQILASRSKWVLTYDLNPVLMPMYSEVNQKFKYQLRYYVKNKRYEYEFLAISNNLIFPSDPQLKNYKRI